MSSFMFFFILHQTSDSDWNNEVSIKPLQIKSNSKNSRSSIADPDFKQVRYCLPLFSPFQLLLSRELHFLAQFSFACDLRRVLFAISNFNNAISSIGCLGIMFMSTLACNCRSLFFCSNQTSLWSSY